MKKLGVADAAGVILINPRPLDAEVKARVAAAKPDEKRFLERFAEVWAALDAAAVYLALDADLELGVSLRFQPGQAARGSEEVADRAAATGLACGTRFPKDALFGVAGHVRAVGTDRPRRVARSGRCGQAGREGVDRPDARPGRRPRQAAARARMRSGPNWAVWAEPPVKDSFLPTFVAAVEIGGARRGRGRRPRRRWCRQSSWVSRWPGWRTTRRHADQIELKEEKDPKTGRGHQVAGEREGVPAGVPPVVRGREGLPRARDVAGSDQAVRAPALDNRWSGETDTSLYFSAPGTREYLADPRTEAGEVPVAKWERSRDREEDRAR